MQRTVTLMVVVLATTVFGSGPAGSQDSGTLRVVALDGSADATFAVTVAVPRLLSAETIGSEAFTATAGGQALEVQAAPLPNDLLDIALLLDATVLQPETRTAVVGAATEFAVGLPTGVRIGIGKTGQAISQQGALTRDRRRALTSLGALEAGRDTPSDGGPAVASLFAPDGDRRPTLVLVTAGSSPAAQAELDAARSADAPVYVIVVQDARHDLVRAGLPSRGLLLTTGQQMLLSAFDTVTADLTAQYEVRIRLPEQAIRTVDLRVDLRDAAASTTVALEVEPASGPGATGTPASRGASDQPVVDGQDQGWGWLPWLIAAGVVSMVAAMGGRAPAPRGVPRRPERPAHSRSRRTGRWYRPSRAPEGQHRS